MTTTARFAVLYPIGGSFRAQVCSTHTTIADALASLSPGRRVGVITPGTEPLANVAMVTVAEHIARELERLGGCDRVEIAGQTHVTVSLLAIGWRTRGESQPVRAAAETIIAALAALPDGVGEERVVAALVAAKGQ